MSSASIITRLLTCNCLSQFTDYNSFRVDYRLYTNSKGKYKYCLPTKSLCTLLRIQRQVLSAALNTNYAGCIIHT
jgi:hypothetical protein